MTPSIEALFDRQSTTLAHAVSAATSRSRVDVDGAPGGALGMFVVRLAKSVPEPIWVVAPDNDRARRIALDIEFFADRLGVAGPVLVYPAADVSPFVELAPDRRASMDRLAVLSHLASGRPCKFLVTSAPALVRRVPPRDALAAHSTSIAVGAEVDRDDLVRRMVDAGYVRVPIAEDAGTFAVRGGIVDVFSPHTDQPVRIELDDTLVTAIFSYDPDDQKTTTKVTEAWICPAREALSAPADVASIKERVRALCDAIDMPTTKARELLAQIEEGRSFYGIDAFLPAFFGPLESVTAHVPATARLVIVDPTAVEAAIDTELTVARNDWEARVGKGLPAFPFPTHFLSETDVRVELNPPKRSTIVVHRTVHLGSADRETSAPLLVDAPHEGDVLSLGATDQTALITELKNQRAAKGKTDLLAPLDAHTKAWVDAGFKVTLTARAQTQGDRLTGLVRSHGVQLVPEATREPGVCVVTGRLSAGFILPSEAVVFVTEEELFGTRGSRGPGKRKRDRARAFIEDLRELKPGDFVVHVDHGIGRYLGLERKVLGQSQLERMRGERAMAVEVLVVEYSGGDRLFLPVSRLNQIQKYAGQEGQQPKMDRLGGQTFSKTKARVRERVKQLADQLLELYAARATAKREPLPSADLGYAQFEVTFPYDETPDQARAISDVLGDLERDQPMDRLVCGDVGFGKTEVALRATFRAAMAGRQVAVLCPTTVLAQQHWLSFRDRLASYPLSVHVLSRFVDRDEQAKVVAGLRDGSIDVVIGTHRLLSKDIHFKNLGLLIIDEEQRFGVAHKERMKQMRATVDVLTLSATPIPRTLQLALGGLRDLSLIATAPVDRRAVRTFVSRWDEHVVREAIRRELARGGQVFFVFNRIDGLYERAQRLQELVPEAKIAVVHGQMKEDSLEQAMTDFVDGQFDVLCSTAIIESGLDIPRANTIIMDRADTLGLAQLYQLRGRVGRSRERAYCYLLTPPPNQMTDEARFRIQALERFTELGSGFHLASLDMELRGTGDILGVEQSGNVALVGFDLFVRMLEEAIAYLKGEPVLHDVDTELTLDVEHYLPEEYIEDVGLRLSLYKRLASAEDDQAIEEIALEMEDRFGQPPPPARQFVRAMHTKPELRELRALGCEATADRVTLHLREDTPLDPAKVMANVAASGSGWRLTPDMRLTVRFPDATGGDAIDRVQELMRMLAPLRRDAATGEP